VFSEADREDAPPQYVEERECWQAGINLWENIAEVVARELTVRDFVNVYPAELRDTVAKRSNTDELSRQLSKTVLAGLDCSDDSG